MTDTTTASTRTTAAVRLGLGLAQGLALYLLHHAQEAKAWPATQPVLFAPLVLVALFIPFVVLAGAGAFRRTGLIAWSLIAAGFAALLAWHGVSQQTGSQTVPAPPVFLAVAAALFIAHHLVQPAHAHRRPIAPYEAYFDTTWMHGVQLALSAAFTGVFWILLFLGAALFDMIGIKAFRDLIAQEAFSIPATTVMFAAAVQLTDVRPSLVRGVRTVALTLLAWLLPLMTLIAAGFLASLPFTGLEPLWKTRAATALLLTAAAHLIVLINAAYQDGEEPPHLVLRWAGRLAGLLLIPIGLLAAYGLSLRIGQHGLTPERVFAAAFVLIALGHAAGYALAAARPGAWMKGLERTNVAMAFVSVALILALFTPLADPARLSVNDQVRRLETGKVEPEAFDFGFLRFKSGSYGRAAFGKLLDAPQSEIRDAARKANALKSASDNTSLPQAETKLTLRDVKVSPKGAKLPESFITQFASANGPPPFCGLVGTPCSAQLRDLDEDGQAEILIQAGEGVAVYQVTTRGWRRYGFFRLSDCYVKGVDPESEQEALLANPIQTAEPDMSDLIFQGRRIRITPEEQRCEIKDSEP